MVPKGFHVLNTSERPDYALNKPGGFSAPSGTPFRMLSFSQEKIILENFLLVYQLGDKDKKLMFFLTYQISFIGKILVIENVSLTNNGNRKVKDFTDGNFISLKYVFSNGKALWG